jgi:hypothetical protein
MPRGEPQVRTDRRMAGKRLLGGEPLAGPVPFRSPQTDGHPMGCPWNSSHPEWVPQIRPFSLRIRKGRTARVYWPMIFEGFDWYSAIQIGIAAAVVGIIVLIGWLQGPPRR